MDTMLIILIILLCLLLVTNIFVIVLFFLIKSHIKEYKENTQDSIKALSDMMAYVIKEFQFNNETHKSVQEWQEKNLAALSDLNTDNAQKIYDTIMQYQGYLNRLGEFMGYRPRGNFE